MACIAGGQCRPFRCRTGKQACTAAKRLGFSRSLRAQQPTSHAATRASSEQSSGNSQSAPAKAPSSNGGGAGGGGEEGGQPQGKVLSSVVTIGGLAALIIAAAVFQEPIKEWILYFSDIVDDMGYPGMVLYFFVYVGLEVLAVPAIPLTMTSGAIFGVYFGSVIVSLAGAVAATISFLIARYAARDKFLPWAEQNKQFRAVNKVIARDGIKVVTLLRLSPLLPLAASNYLYGLTSVSLRDYFIGTWVGMLPGTVAYVSAGYASKVAIAGDGEMPLEWWQIALGVAVSAGVIWYIGTLAKKELQNLEDEEDRRSGGGQVSMGAQDAASSKSSSAGKSYTTAGRSDE